jgi:hypothetical protein
MFFAFLVLTVIMLLMIVGGLAFNLSLYKHADLPRVGQRSSKSPTTLLHEAIF